MNDMKRLILGLLLFAAAVSPLRAQDEPQLSPIIPERETIVLDNLVAVPNMTLGMYQYTRQCVLKGLERRRINVIDVEAEGIGRPDIVYPAYRYSSSRSGHPFDINRAVSLMNEFQEARYYVSLYVSRLQVNPVDHKSGTKDKDGKEIVKTDYTANLDVDVYIYDAERQTSEGPIRWHYTYTGATEPEFAERTAVQNMESKARSFVSDRFRYKASVIELGTYNKRGKLEDLYLSCGLDMDVQNGDVFYIYSVTESNGIEKARKLGKVKAREVTGQHSCRCTVSNGEAEINLAFLNGERVVAVSDEDRYF